jgi:tripartite-type tricarboxylate transporter receptor subunit TctC
MKSALAVCFTVLLGVAGSGLAAERGSPDDSAAGFPARPVRLIIPFPPGGSNDIMGRYFAQYLTERLGKQVVVDNRPGADAIIGTEIASRAQPDGYTLLIASAAFAVNAATRKVPYDPHKSFSWVGTLGYGPSVLSVGPALKVNSAKELIAYGRANPGKLTLATSGGFAHMASELFNHLSGMKMLVVLYKGGVPGVAGRHGRASAGQPGLADSDAAAPEVRPLDGPRYQRLEARHGGTRTSDYRRVRRGGLRGQ